MAELETEGFGVYFKPDFWAALDDNQREQLRVYMEAFEVFNEREKKYHSLWMQYGAVDSYQHVRSKAARTQFYLEGHEDESDPIDLINYTAFLIRNMRAGRIRGDVARTIRMVAQEDIKAGDLMEVDPATGKAVVLRA